MALFLRRRQRQRQRQRGLSARCQEQNKLYLLHKLEKVSLVLWNGLPGEASEEIAKVVAAVCVQCEKGVSLSIANIQFDE